MKKNSLIVLIVLLAVGALGITKDRVIASAVSFTSSNILGAPVKIGSLSVGIFKQSVRIRNLKVYQPKGFPSDILMDIPVISVDYDIKSLLTGKLHFPLIEINMEVMNIIRNKNKELNVEALKVAQKKEGATEKKPAKPAKSLAMQIDTLKLSAGKVVYKDYSAGEKPVVQVYDSGIKNKTYKNITSAQALIALLLSESLKNTAIQGAKLYAANAILGVGFLPAGVALTLAGKASDTLNVDLPFNKAYEIALQTAKNLGELKTEDMAQGTIHAVVSKADVSIKVKRTTDNTTSIVVTARQMLLPKPEIAKGVLYELSQKLK